MTYERYCVFRDKAGLKDYQVSKIADIGTSTFSDWKNGRSEPKEKKLRKIASALGVPYERFVSNWENIEWDSNTQEIYEKDDNYYMDDSTKEMAEFLFKNPEYKVLFDASRKVKPEDLQKAVRAIGLFIED